MSAMFRYALLLMLLIQFPSAAAIAGTSPVPLPSATPSIPEDAVSAQLKAAVVQSKKSLGPLSLQQEHIFDEEVVPDYPLFIKDYHRDGQTIQAQTDLEGIRNITRFIAPLGSKILLYLNVDFHCAKCVADAQPIRQMMLDRVTRRGFVPVWIASEELAAGPIGDQVGPRGAKGFLQVDIVQASVDQEDAEHDVRYLAKAQISIQGIAGYQDQAELYETDSFQTEADKLLTHAFADLGSKADLAGITSFAKDDLLIEVDQIASFAQYQALRDAIRSDTKDVALVEQRRLSRGKAVFALKTRKSAGEIKNLLKGLRLDDKQVVAVGMVGAQAGSAGPKLVMEIR